MTISLDALRVTTQYCDKFLHIFRQLAFKMQRLLRRRMYEAEHARVQSLPFKIFQQIDEKARVGGIQSGNSASAAGVNRIAEYRMAEMR